MISRAERSTLMKLAKDVFLQGPHMIFVNTTKELCTNKLSAYMGYNLVNFPTEGVFFTQSVATNGMFKTAWFGESKDLYPYNFDFERTYSYVIFFPPGTRNIAINISVNTAAGPNVSFHGLGEPKTQDYQFETDVIKKQVASTRSLNFKEAAASCQEEGGHVASITSQADVDSSQGYFWLGATYDPNLDAWLWQDGSVWNFTNWASGYPNYRGNCATLNYKLQWMNSKCSDTRPYKCKSSITSYKINGKQNLGLIFANEKLSSNKFVISWIQKPTKIPNIRLSQDCQ